MCTRLQMRWSARSPGGTGAPSRLDLQQLKVRRFGVKLGSEAAAQRSPTHSDVEAQQVADHGRDSGQDDHPGEVVDQRVHRQAQQPEGGVQLLGRGQRTVSIVLTRLRSQHRLICSTVNVTLTLTLVPHPTAFVRFEPGLDVLICRGSLTFISLVANFRTLLTTLSSSFLLGFFSIFRNTLICNHKHLQLGRVSLGAAVAAAPASFLGATCSVRSTEELLYLQSV